MAKKKPPTPMTLDEFHAMQENVDQEAAEAAMERIKRSRDAAEDARRRRVLVNRSMTEIVEAMMTPPNAVDLPTDFAAAWATDRPMFLGLINRPLSAAETKGVAGAMATLMEHNRRLRLLAKDLVERLEVVSSSIDERVISLRHAAGVMEETAKSAMRAGEDYIDVQED